jgi:hypothetical protein
MKELKLKTKTAIELNVKQQKQVEHILKDKIIPHKNHTVWEINNDTLEIKKAEYSNVTYVFGQINKNEIITKVNHSYVSALNKKSALQKHKKNKNGSKKVSSVKLNLI